jgi:tetratricopeptide (TPR) repeat protein
MRCPICGEDTPASGGRCASCKAPFAAATQTATGALTPPYQSDAETALQDATTMSHVDRSDPARIPDVTTTGAYEDTTGLPTSAGGGLDERVTKAGPLAAGQAFGDRYHIIKLLGVGGMGAVYQAWDAELGVAVALKVIRADRRRRASPKLETRFKNELVLARQVTHKNVVRIHDLGTIDGIKYITMPYIQGDDLARIMRRDGKLPVDRTLKLARQIAAGLAAAHQAGVVHRDLKPANIMIAGAGDEAQAQIMDFGISASSGDAATGGVVGTLEYMAPEQAEGKAVDARADVYAFGLILLEMLVGARTQPPPAERVSAMRQRVADGLPRLRSIEESIPAPLDEIVDRCLQRDPEARYANGMELHAALSCLDDRGEIIPEPRRLTWPQAVAAIAVVVAMLGGTYYLARPVPPVHHEPVPVLIAEFENLANDPVFTGSLEQALALALEGAPYITVFRTSEARAIAAQIAPEKGSRITEEVGRLIARREGLKVLLAGAIDTRAGGYHLSLHATDPATAKAITTLEEDVKDRAQVLRTVASMAIKVRQALGESKTEMTKLAAAETFTASSIDAMRAYARGQELSRANKIQEALQAYQEAVRFDPQFGRAYAGMGSIYSNYFKQPDKAESNYQLALKYLDRMTDREKYRTLGTYYLNVVRNYDKAIENYETLVRWYPADDAGHGNLALAYVYIGNVTRAVAEERIALAIYPRNSLQRYNYAMYSMYAGDFPTSIAEASRLLNENPTFEYPLLPLALSRLLQGDATGARDAYAKLAIMSPVGASLSKLGLADLEMYFGREREAITVLHDGIAADRKQGSASRIAQKSAALAEAYLASNQPIQAAEAAAEAVKLTRREATLFPAARVLVRAGREEQARQVAHDLENMLQQQTAAYARLIAGEIAAGQGRFGEAIDAFRDAQKRHDSWFARFLLGKAYVEAGHFAEAVAELDLCVKRRGETADVFVSDMPTLRYLPPAYYWLARSKEGVGARAEASRLYEQFLNLRAGANPADPFVADAQRRLNATH